MKKKLRGPFCILLAALIGLLSFPAGAAGILAAGECGASGNNVTWTLDKEGLLTVSGTGAMYDYSSKEDVPWYAYRGQLTKAEVQNGVTSVGQNAFRDCTALESVTLPTKGLKNIRNVAFYNCAALKEIVIPDGVTTIDESAFGFCGLTEVKIPASVTKIGESVFYRCSALTAIEVDAANEKYSSANGILFDKIDAGDAGGDNGGGAEGGEGESGEEGGEGEGEEGGGGQAVQNKTLLICYPAAKADAEYTVPDGVKTIGSYAFVNALHLKKITLPDGLTTIEPYAFAYGILNEVHIPASLTTIGERAFYECRGLSTTDENNNIKAEGNVYFSGSRQQWNSLKMGADNNCLTNANIVFGDMKQDTIVAKGECGALGSNAIWALSDKGDFLISGTGAMSSYKSAASVPWANYLESGATEAKDLRGDIKTVTIEGDILEDGVVVKTGITNVGDYAFYDCTKLTTVKLPSTVKTIGAQAFSDCDALTGVNLSDTTATSIGDYAFNGTSKLSGVLFPETLKTIGKQAFMHSGLTDVTIPAGVTRIGEWAFRWCGSLTSFTMAPIASGVTPHKSAVIGDYALANCAALTNVNFTENLASLGEYALADCAKLEGVSDKSSPAGVWIPENVFNIGSCAFHGCAALTAVNVDENNITYCSASGMLMNKDKTCIYCYPAGRAEESCAVPESIASVAPFAFDGATKLKNVIYAGTQAQWDALIESELPEAERTLVGPYNDPFLNATVTCEGVDPNDDAKLTKVSSWEITSTEDGGRQLEAVIHCGVETLGAQVLCAVYDADGRFLRMQAPKSADASADEESGAVTELNPGESVTLAYALDENTTQTGQIRLLILDGENLPCCEKFTPKLSDDAPAEE